MIKYIGNKDITSINYQGMEIKKLYLGNALYYWNLPSNDIPIDPWELYHFKQEYFYYSNILKEEYDPTNDPVGLNEYFTFKTAMDTLENRWIGQNESNRIRGLEIPTTSENISEIVWHLEDAGDGFYYIVNENGYYWAYTGATITDMPLTNNINSACKVKIGKGYPYLSYTNNYVFQEQSSGKKYGLNNLNGYNYQFNWYTGEDIFVTKGDANVYYRLYKVSPKKEIDYWRKIFITYAPVEVSNYVYEFYDAEHYGYSLDKETIEYYDPITAKTEVLTYELIDGEEEDTFIYNAHKWTKKFYKVNLTNGESVLTDLYTFGEDKGEASMPVDDFMFNFNFKQYDASTKSVPNDEKANWKQNLVLNGNPNVNVDHITVTRSDSYAEYPFSTASANPFNLTSANPNLTIIYKIGACKVGGDMISNRGSQYNWMLRPYETYSAIHYAGETAKVNYDKNAVKTLVLVNNNKTTTHRCIENGNVATSTDAIRSGANYLRFFRGYVASEPYTGVCYWMFVARRVLSEEEINKVIAYNEGL